MKPGWQTARYPKAIWRPWRYLATSPAEHVGKPTYYANLNHPRGAMLHIMQGWMTTVLRWADIGFYPKSWHYSIGRDGTVYQHLDHKHGGYHGGITSAKARDYPPRWRLWRGASINVNHYTIGIEHEGLAGQPFTAAQAKASIELCLWLADLFEWPVDEDHFPPHAAVDLRDRPNDFNIPALRPGHYAQLKAAAQVEDKDKPMTPEERKELDSLKDTNKALKDRVERIEKITYSNSLPVTATESNKKTLDKVTGKDNPLGSKFELKGEEALTFAHAMGLSTMKAVQHQNDVIRDQAKAIAASNSGIDVAEVLDALAEAYRSTQG